MAKTAKILLLVFIIAGAVLGWALKKGAAEPDLPILVKEEKPLKAPRPKYVPDEIIVKFKPQAKKEEIEDFNLQQETKERYESPYAHFKVLKIPKTKTVEEMLEREEVLVEPQSKQVVKMFLKIPEEDKYYNQHWTVSLSVAGKPEQGASLALAVYPRYQIETESKSGLKEKPAGLIAFEPSTLSFKDLALGKKEGAKIIIYNNNAKTQQYRITPKVIAVDPTREQIVASPGYPWIPNIKWITPDKKRLEIKPGESKELNIAVNIPKKKEYYQRKWEALIFVEPEEGPSGFARAQIQTQGKEK